MAEIDRQFAPRQPERIGAREITTGVIGTLTTGPAFRSWVLVLGALSLLGAVTFIIRLVTAGTGQRVAWGYLAATFAYLLATVQTAPLLAIGLRFVHADLRRQLSRASMLFAVCGLLAMAIYLPLLFTLPPLGRRRTLWINWPWGAPGLFDTIAIVLLVLHGLGLLYLASIPDFAVARDYGPASRRPLYARLALRWKGTRRQWWILRSALALEGALYAIFLAFVQILIPFDFAMSLIPGWYSSVFPAYQMITALEAAVALCIVALYLWRRYGGLHAYLRPDHFSALSTTLFALALLSFYMWWSDFITRWYGRTPVEQQLLLLLEFGPYLVPWITSFALMFVLPFLALLWRPIRHSMEGATLVSMGVLIGVLLDRVRLYVAAFSIGQAGGTQLETVPGTQFPDLLDLGMVAGTLAGAALLYLVAAKLVPPMAMWEAKEDLMLRLRRPFLKGEYNVLGKPR